MNKKYMLFILPLFAITLIAAAYLVSSFIIVVDVQEPFTVEYAIVGNAGNWDGVTTCETYAGDWIPDANGTVIDVGGLYAGEGRLICTRITNAGEGDVDYTFSGEVVSGLGNLVECTEAFGNPTTNGTALGSSVTIDGVVVLVDGGATPVQDCQVTISVNRG